MLDNKFRDGEQGVVYTPMEAAREVIAALPDEAFAEGKLILDACCGAGNLLVAIVERRLALGLSDASIAATTFGIDINEEAIAYARKRVEELLGHLHAEEIQKNIRVGDFLEKGQVQEDKIEQLTLF